MNLFPTITAEHWHTSIARARATPNPISQRLAALNANHTNMNTKYRKKLEAIEAFQMTQARREDNSDWPEWLHVAWQAERETAGALYPVEEGTGDGMLSLGTPEGHRLVDWDSFIIRDASGGLTLCKPEVFAETYEEVESPPDVYDKAAPSESPSPVPTDTGLS